MSGERMGRGDVIDQRSRQAGIIRDARPIACTGPICSSEPSQTMRTPEMHNSAEVADSATSVKPAPARPRVDRMPPWKVLLHNDDKNEMGYVIETIIELTSLNPHDALIKMVEAHKTGVALLLTVHREYAELLQEQFKSKLLTVTIEPDC